MLIDSHCHLSSTEILENLPDVMRHAEEAGVCYILNAGGRFDELPRQLEISCQYPQVFTASGVHPHDAASYSSITAKEVLMNTRFKEVVAVGECGLDYFYDFSPREVQIKVFEQMIEAAQISGLPIIVHTREAEKDTIGMLSSAYKSKPFKGVIHCFSSRWEVAKAALDIGFYISASGMITFKNAQDLRSLFAKVPLEKLLVETDSPYLAPVPYRGKINQPAFVVQTALSLAEIKGIELDQISTITSKNFFDLFDKAKPNR